MVFGLQILARALVLKVWFRFSRRRWQAVPKVGPALLVANHGSHLDPVLIGAALQRPPFFLARASLFRPRWFGVLIRFLGAVPIDQRGAGVGGFRTTLEILRAGEVAVVFPEGTRSRDGRLGEFHSGAVRIAQKSGAPVVPIWIEGSCAAMPRGRRFPRPRPIEVRFGVPYRIDEHLDPVVAAERLRERVARLGGVQ